jgi:hypothetical protein
VAGQRFAVELVLGQETYELLQYAHSLLSHAIAPNDVAAVVHRAEARRAAEYAETLGDVLLEERMRAALQFLYPKARLQGRAESGSKARP